jgi:hypothetical protein
MDRPGDGVAPANPIVIERAGAAGDDRKFSGPPAFSRKLLRTADEHLPSEQNETGASLAHLSQWGEESRFAMGSVSDHSRSGHLSGPFRQPKRRGTPDAPPVAGLLRNWN